jgi:hypothetical protein
MQTVIENETGLSLHLIADSQVVVPTDYNIEIRDENGKKHPDHLYPYIDDLNASTGTVISNVEPPEDWARGKYFYTNGQWVPNKAFVPYHERLKQL